MHRMVFEGIRCFHQEHSYPIKPITLLVGENSSGKTTFLALTRIAWDIAKGNLNEDIFNEEPFLLGSYDQIASLRGGRAGRAKYFSVGIEVRDIHAGSDELFSKDASITATFHTKKTETKLERWSFQCGHFSIEAGLFERTSGTTITITTPSGSIPIKVGVPFPDRPSIIRFLQNLQLFIVYESIRPKGKIGKPLPHLSDAQWDRLQKLSVKISNALGERPYAFAPIRTRPQRTYDPLKEVPRPEGSHVPMVLAKTLSKKSFNNSGLKQALSAFGQASGLFDSIEVKRKGLKESDPFQIYVRTTGPTFNLVDVGYGVSQILPIIVDVVQHPKNTTFLLQQPEVHLHPRAQAELGSFLATFAKEQNKRFIIETHSDYLIDRIRMDVRDKKILSRDDVVILYFDKNKTTGGVDIAELNIDESGNIIKAPSTYRQFFLEEERRMLGV